MAVKAEQTHTNENTNSNNTNKYSKYKNLEILCFMQFPTTI